MVQESSLAAVLATLIAFPECFAGNETFTKRQIHIRYASTAHSVWPHGLPFSFKAIGNRYRNKSTADAKSAEAKTNRRLVRTAASERTVLARLKRLLLYPQNRVFCRLGDSEFDDGLGWNLDLLLCLRIEASTCFPLLLYKLPEAGQDEFAVLFDLLVCELAERIEEYSSGSFVGLRGSRQRDLKFGLGHF
jgi:hypothetical protein